MDRPNERIAFNDAYEASEWFTRQIMHARAHDEISTRLNEAHQYVQKHLMPDAWGKIVWHSILDDAIRMRKEFENEHHTRNS